MPYVETISFCEEIRFNHIAVYNRLSNLFPFKSPGTDNFHPFVLKCVCDIIYNSLSIIFQTSLYTLSLPNIWKTANVSSILRKETGVILPIIALLASPVLPVKQ